MEFKTLYCPNKKCRYYGLPGNSGKLVKNGTSKGHKQALCQACGSSVSLTYGTAYYQLESNRVLFDIGIRALAEGNSLRSAARIVQVDKETTRAWLNRAARQCRRVMLYHWHDLHVDECQLDELWSFVHTKEQNLPLAKLNDLSYGDAWVWIAFAANYRLVVAWVVGKRTQENANLLLKRVAHVLDDTIPFFLSINCLPIVPLCCMSMGSGINQSVRGTAGVIPTSAVFLCLLFCMLK